MLSVSYFQAAIYAIQKLRKFSRAKAEELFSQGPRRLKAEQEQLLREIDSKTLSEKDRKRFLQRIGKLPYGESDHEDDVDG